VLFGFSELLQLGRSSLWAALLLLLLGASSSWSSEQPSRGGRGEAKSSRDVAGEGGAAAEWSRWAPCRSRRRGPLREPPWLLQAAASTAAALPRVREGRSGEARPSGVRGV
jgi:hypothetical protein